jgi:TupA-like ATPgrasp
MSVAHGISTELLWPLCRAYAKRLGDQPADRAFVVLGSFAFRELHGYWPDFRNPRSFSEKVWHRGMFDRDPRLTMLSDKLLSRDYIAARVGPEHLVPVLWSGEDPDAIPFDELPAKFVLKTNHGCGYNVMVGDKSAIDRAAVRAQLAGYMRQNYCNDIGVGLEWAYKNIRPRIMVETLLESPGGSPPDYKLYCYSGRVEFMQVHAGRHSATHVQDYHDRDLNLVPGGLGRMPNSGVATRPAKFAEMVRIAEALAGDFSFIRVDLYELDGRIYAGELTCYPGGGIARVFPRELDLLLGEKWR